jgi:hypothetical protein
VLGGAVTVLLLEWQRRGHVVERFDVAVAQWALAVLTRCSSAISLAAPARHRAR